MNTATPRLGIDIGRVIIDGSAHPSGDDTAFFKGGIDNALRTPAMRGAFESIARLTKLFEGQVWLVSKCGERVEARTRQWLDHHRFFERTAIDAGHLRFCRQRPEKAIHCAQLKITHFIDDRPDVLEALEGIVPHRYLFGPQRGAAPGGVVHCPDWDVAEATEGGDFVDDRFASNWRAAGEAGLRRGAYHFFTLCTPGAVQAENFLKTVPADARALAPAVDLELKGNCAQRPPRQWVHRELGAFLDAVESATGQQAILYLGQSWDGFETRYRVKDAFDRPIWQRSIILRPRSDWRVWQLSGMARVEGVSGPVDFNVGRL